jgi:hypothetical protein
MALTFKQKFAGLKAILDDISDIPGNITQQDGGPQFMPSIGTFDPTVDHENPDADTANVAKLAKMTFELTAVLGLGRDETRKTYDPDAVIAGDTYQPDPLNPSARLGGVVHETGGNRVWLVTIKCEAFWGASAATAHYHLERVRTRLNLPSVRSALALLGLARNSIGPSHMADYDDDSGRRVSVQWFELKLNAADSATDAPVTTIEKTESEFEETP